jgi:hypothetical protein
LASFPWDPLACVAAMRTIGINSSKAHQMYVSLSLDRNAADLGLDGPLKWRQITHVGERGHSSVVESKSTRFLPSCEVSSLPEHSDWETVLTGKELISTPSPLRAARQGPRS